MWPQLLWTIHRQSTAFLRCFWESVPRPSSKTQGQSVRSGERAGRKFWSTGERAHGYRLSPSYFQKFKRIPAPDWAQKMLCIIVPNRRTVSTEFSSWVPTRTWKLSSRLFSLPDWLSLGLRGCSVTESNNLVGIRRLLLLWLEKLFCRSVCLSLLWKLMWTTATLGKFTNNAALTMRNMFVGNHYYLFSKSILPRRPRGG